VNLTLYGRDVLQLDVVSNGVLSCLPYVGMFAMTSTAKVFDHCRQNDYLPLSTLRKIFTGLGMIIPAVCMASLHFVSEKDTIGNVVLLTLGMSGHQLGKQSAFAIGILKIKIKCSF
jgi:ACS family sodium-dependent inorganic phosphate cotransporter-like MFS transporter 1/2/3/4